MKKRVCSVLLAAVLCVTMLSVVALATESSDCNHTYTGNNYVANVNGINHSRKCDNCGYVDTSSSSQHCDNGLNNNAKDGKCDFCSAELAVSFNDSSRTICATTWEAAFKEISSGSGTLYPIKNVTDGITYNGNGNVTINLAGLTINELKVTKGRLGAQLAALQELLKREDNWLIMINADPDAMAGAMAFQRLIRHRVHTVTIARINEVTRPDNLSMIRYLRIPLVRWQPVLARGFQRFAIVDSQPSHNVAFDDVDFSVIIDHHPPAEPPYATPFIRLKTICVCKV